MSCVHSDFSSVFVVAIIRVPEVQVVSCIGRGGAALIQWVQTSCSLGTKMVVRGTFMCGLRCPAQVQKRRHTVLVTM